MHGGEKLKNAKKNLPPSSQVKFQPKICLIRKPCFARQANLDIVTSWLKNWTYLNQTTQIYDKTHN